MTLHLEDYALIDDCETAALVGKDGSIDWLCWPRFDSAACFAALLGTPEHGRWLVAPSMPGARVSRCYRPGTLILETTFETDTGTVTVVDFMPVRDTVSDLVRLVVGRAGQMRMRIELVLRFDYGSAVPWVTRGEDGSLLAIAGPDMVVLRSSADVHGEGLHSVGEFVVTAGQTVPFTLTHAPSHLPPPAPIDTDAAIKASNSFWSDWSGRCRPAGEWSDAVQRSLITLKALTYRPTGGIVAAPTTSLPELLGGARNWDYRFCWLRDATLTLLALINSGYIVEASDWRDWLLRAVAGSPSQLQIMYGLAGERRLTEWEATWLPGYEGSKPVRIGNGAHGQLQLDVFGEVMDALHQAHSSGLASDHVGWDLQCSLVEHLESIWREPDEGIWEVRGPRRQFTFSKLMAWVAFDRAVQSAEAFDLPGPRDRWRRIRDEIHADVCAQGFNTELNSFVQVYGGWGLDASLLLLPITGFLPPEDPRVRGTVAAIEHGLLTDGLVRRYDTAETADGLPAGEGAFLACSFWLADAYIMLGRLDDARRLFEHLLGLRNDLGLLAEEYDVSAGRQVGNFPQAFSHLALVNTAMHLTRISGPAKQRSGAEPR